MRVLPRSPVPTVAASAVAFVLALATGPGALSQDRTPPGAPISPSAAADDCVAATSNGDNAALKLLASREEPDPWLVAEELCARERPDVARAVFARRDPVERDALLQYIGWRDDHRQDLNLRGLAGECDELIAKREYRSVVEKTAVAPSDIPTVSRIRILLQRGIAAKELRDAKLSMESLQLAIRGMEALGWDGSQTCLGNRLLAVAAIQCGNASLAVGAAESSAAWARRRGRLPQRVKVLNTLAVAYSTAERVVDALRVSGELSDLLDSEEAAKEVPPIPAIDQVGALRNAAAYNSDFGYLDAGLRLFTRARNLAEKDARGLLPGIDADMGRCLARMGRLDEARSLLDPIIDEGSESDDPRPAFTACSTLAFFLGREGRWADGEVYGRRALALAERIEDPVTVLRVRLDLCYLMRELGRYEEALAAVDGVIREAQQRSLPDVETLARTQRAWILDFQKKFKEAIVEARTAVERRRTLEVGLGVTDLLAMRRRHAAAHEAGLHAATMSGDTSAALYFFEEGRAAWIRSRLGGAAPESRIVTGLSESSLRSLDALRESYSLAIEKSRSAASRRAPAQELAAALRKEQDCFDTLQRAVLGEERTAGGTAAGAARVRDVPNAEKLLGATDAAILLSVQDDFAVGLLVCPGESRVIRLEVDPKALVAISGAIQGAGRGLSTSLLKDLRERLVGPLKVPPRVDRVWVVADGAAVLLPWNMLLGQRRVLFAPSLSVVAMLGDRGEHGRDRVLAVGSPAYPERQDPAITSAYPHVRSLPRLPFAAEEVETVAGSAHDVRLLGGDATKSRLLTEIFAPGPGWMSLHFACHVCPSSENPLQSCIALGPEASGDGILTAAEIARRQFPVGTVVMAGCDSGGGASSDGEGQVGLVSAWFCAGAKRVLASTWSVDDKATCALMREFYRSWRQGTPASKALLSAQAMVRETKGWEDPYFWAGWQLWGIDG